MEDKMITQNVTIMKLQALSDEQKELLIENET